MVLVDTSVWVDHFRRGNPQLEGLLEAAAVVCHPFIVGELACGSLKNRAEILALLSALPQTPLVEHHEALTFIDAERLYSRGLGWIDIHLLASARLAACRLWSLDKALQSAAASSDLAP